MQKLYPLCLFFFCLSYTLTAQVHINEYSASNLNSFHDSFLKTEDWIELYNDSEMPVDLSGWHLSDKDDKPKKWEIPAGTIIPAKGYLVFLCSGRDLVVNGTEYHTNFKLAQTKDNEFVLLSDANGDVVDMFPLAITLVEHSRCRATDGSENWMVCTDPSYGSSNNGTPQVKRYTATPSMDLAAGFYDSTQVVSLINNEPNSVLRYTLDGTNPRDTSPVYTEPLIISSTQVVKALAFSNEEQILPGKMDFSTYFIGEDFTLAVFSVAADQVIELANGNGGLIPIGSLEYFNVDKEREATSFGSLNRHGQDSWVLPHRSLDWVSRDEMGYSKAVQAPLFSYSDRDEYQKFMFRNSGDDNYPADDAPSHNGSTHIRDEYVQTLALEGGMELDTRAVERVVVFLNGQYWGVYGMRDRPVDHDYTDYYYDQGKYDIQYLSTWGRTRIQYGGTKAIEEWKQLRDFILESDMSIPANYEMVKDSLNYLSLIDYMIANTNVVASDWLNYNTGWWRGLDPDGDHKKWGYILWDLDATFDYYINYSGVPNTNPDADPCDLEDISDYMDEFFENGDNQPEPSDCSTVQDGEVPYPATDAILSQVVAFDGSCCFGEWDNQCQAIYDFYAADLDALRFRGNVGKHEKIFLKLLLESDDFRQLYYSRYADMMNTVFSCENMLTTLDTMLSVIEPEMPRQIERWGGSMAEWGQNVLDLRNFISARCQLLDDGIMECYDELNGPYALTLMTQPAGIADIHLNTLELNNLPWTGDYFGGMDNKIEASIKEEFADDYVFQHWVSTSGNVVYPDSSLRKANINLSQADTLIAVYDLVNDLQTFDARYGVSVFPNPAQDYLSVSFDLPDARQVQLSLYSVLGQKVADFPDAGGFRSAGEQYARLNLPAALTSGLYFLVIRMDDERGSFKVSIEK